MADKPDVSRGDKKAGKAEKKAADASTKDGLKVTRENSNTRQEVREQKTSQGLPNKG